MNNIINKNNHSNSSLFETFKIEDKIQEFEEMLVAQDTNLKNKSVIIAVPSLDESMRDIYKDDRVLYDAQLEDAHALAQHIMLNMDADVVSIFTNYKKINSVLDDSDEYLILLHEFTEFEKNSCEKAKTNGFQAVFEIC